MSKLTVLKPRMSEKAYGLSQQLNVYIFDVPSNANKYTVAAAVTEQFGVAVKSVNISNVDGKAKRTISKKGRVVKKGRQSDVKKAYVTLKSGESLPFFAAVEEAEAKDKAQAEKVAEKAEKAEKKETSTKRLHIPRRTKKEKA